MDVKEIKIFLASSIVEFDHDRKELESYMNRLNAEYVKRGIWLNLEICENLSNAVALGRKQDDFNEVIRSSRYMYLLVGERIGQYTEEEFDVALEHFRATGTPLIYTYFKRLPEGRQADGSVVRFMKRLGDGIGHFWSEFSSLDSIKLNIVLELMRDPDVGGVVQFEDGRALLDGEEVMSLEQVPIYGGNEDLQAMRAELEELESKCAELKIAAMRSFDDDAMLEYAEAAKRRAEVADRIHQAEMAILENMNLIASKSRSGNEIDPREKEAARLIGEGDYRGANAILKDKQWESDIDTAAEVLDSFREKARQYVSSRSSLIANMISMGVTEKTALEIESIYERACEVAERWHVQLDVLYDFARFLRIQRNYKKGIEYAARYTHWCELDPDCSLLTLGQAYDLLGALYHLNKNDVLSEPIKKKAIEFLESIESRTTDEELELAYARASLGGTYWATNRYSEAKEILEQAISAMEADESASPEELSLAYNRIALVSNGLNLLDDSEKYHRKAASIREKLASSGNPTAKMRLSTTYHNLGFLYAKQKRYKDAEREYEKAFSIKKQIAENNPAAYEPSLAMTAIQFGRNYGRMGFPEVGEPYIQMGLSIRRRLLAVNPNLYSSGVAIALKEYGVLIRDAAWEQRYGEALAMFEEAISLQQDSALRNPARHEGDLAVVLDEAAKFFSVIGQDDRAREAFNRAVELRKKWFEAEPRVHARMYSKICFDCAEFLHGAGDDSLAEVRARAAYEVRCGLYEEYPDVYADEYASTSELLAEILESLGKDDEARVVRERAAQVRNG